MRALATGSAVLALLLLFSLPAISQPAIAGIVKDASGAVLPGVTVEAASPVLIEKSRTVVTDGYWPISDHRSDARHLQRDVHAVGFRDRQA